jgi:uncharacterized glyoxalase superfamily protein PhnB
MQRVIFPNEYQQVMPYLVIKGAADFIKFMQDVFDAKEKMRFMQDKDLIAHAEITIGESVIMITDATDEFKPCTGGCFVFVADADRIYAKAIAAGATSLMTIRDQPYGRSGGIMDPFGNTWWIKTHDPNLLP